MKKDIEKDETHYNFKGLFKYITTVVSWTLFVLLMIVGVLLLYYYISVRLYATKGDKYEPEFSIYTIVSQSMEPTIDVYDVIINTKVDKIEDVEINDVITFISTSQITNGMTITHRVTGKKTLDNGEVCLITRGDNNTQEDLSCVRKNNIIGVTKAVVPKLGKLQVFLGSKIGLLFLILIPALYIIVKDLLKIIKNLNNPESKKKDVKKDKELKSAYDDLKKTKSKDSKKR